METINYPKTDDEIMAYALLQEISRLLIVNKSPYSPENELRANIIIALKKQYYELLTKINDANT